MARMDILNKQTRKQINRLNTTLFTPALLFTKVAFSLTGSKSYSLTSMAYLITICIGQLKQLWIIPVLFILVTAISAGAAYALGRLCRLRPTQRYVFNSLSLSIDLRVAKLTEYLATSRCRQPCS